MIQPLEDIPDYEQRLARQDAFWDREVLDRPMAGIIIRRNPPPCPAPQSRHSSLRERWLDAEYQAACIRASVLNHEYLGDALPYAFPNLGPELFSAFWGCDLVFGEDTSWSVPILHDWQDADSLCFSTDNPYWRALEDLTRACLAAGRGLFYTGLSDFQANTEALAAFRDPLQLNFDLVDALPDVKRLLPRLNESFLWAVDHYHDWLRSEGQAVTTWAGIVSTRRWYVVQADFSCMVSNRMFEDAIMPGIVQQVRHFEASLYHLDGPNALRHLDALLSIPELNAIQWIPGAGRGRASDWLPVFQRIQAAGKGVQVWADLDEVETVVDALHPEGVWLEIREVPDRETADSLIRRLARWR